MGKIEIRVRHVNMIKKIQTNYRNPDSGNGSFISEKAPKGQGMTHSYRYVETIHNRVDVLTRYFSAWMKRLTMRIPLFGAQRLSLELKIQQPYSCFTTDQKVRLKVAGLCVTFTYRIQPL